MANQVSTPSRWKIHLFLLLCFLPVVFLLIVFAAFWCAFGLRFGLVAFGGLCAPVVLLLDLARLLGNLTKRARL